MRKRTAKKTASLKCYWKLISKSFGPDIDIFVWYLQKIMKINLESLKMMHWEADCLRPCASFPRSSGLLPCWCRVYFYLTITFKTQAIWTVFEASARYDQGKKSAYRPNGSTILLFIWDARVRDRSYVGVSRYLWNAYGRISGPTLNVIRATTRNMATAGRYEEKIKQR